MNLNMKPMIYTILTIMALISFGYMHSASAGTLNSNDVQSAGFSDLTDADKALVIKEVADKVAASKLKTAQGGLPTATESVESAQKWVDIASGMGRGIVTLVKELGVTVNEFLKTPAGLMTIGLLAFHVMGKAIIHVAAGVVMPFVIIPLWIWSYRRICLHAEVTVERTGLFKYKKTFKAHDSDDGGIAVYRAVHWVMFALFGIVEMVVLFNW